MNLKISNIILITSLFITLSCSKRIINADILIINGIVYNGVDSIPNRLSIAIKDDKIIYIGEESDVSINVPKIINAKGLIVSPGFIDPHTHADRDLNEPSTSSNKPFLFQGITTVVIGNDGDSFYPISKYKNLYRTQGIGTNAVLLFGHGTIREQVIGRSDRRAFPEEIIKMQQLVQQEMNAGAFGMSTGLFYAPGSYANTDEVIALAETVAKNNGIYDTHLRDESSYTIGLIPAIEEAINIGRQAHLPIHISHIKCLGVDVWNKSHDIIRLINDSRKEGIDVTANQYPYDASATSLQAAVVPRWTESGGKDSVFVRFDNPKLKQRIIDETKINITRRGGAEKLLIVKSEDSLIVGMNLLEISQFLNLSPSETVYNILRKSNVKIASFNMISDDIINFMKQDWVVTGSDGNTGHPRKYGSFPRKYRKYVLEDNVIDFATFINGSTSKTADIFRIPDRGKLLEGHYADIIIFNPKTFTDKADYRDAFQFSEGIEFSIINGKLSIENGIFTSQFNGRVLQK